MNASLVKRRYTEDFNMDTTLRLADMLLFQLTAAGYNFGPEIMGHITLTRGMLAATHGHGPSTIDVYAHAGLVFMGAGLPNKALELGELALSLVDRSTSYEARARAHFIHLAHIHFWMKDFSSILPRFQRGIEFATRSGSQFLVFWGEGVAAELSAFAGIPLHLQHMRIQQGLDNLHTVYQRTDNLPWTSTYFLAAVSRVNYAYNPQLVPQKELSGLLENADGLMQDMIAAKDATAICSWSISEMKLALLREDISMGERAMLRFAEYKHGSVTQWTQCEVELYTALLIGVAVRHGPLRPEFVKRLRLAVHRLNTFAKRNSGTFGARASLARGIWNVHQQQYHQAFINFQQASQQAHEAKNLFLEATALEWSALAAESTIASNLATTIRQKAARLYRQFGAPVLAEKLESRKSQIRNEGALERVSLSQTIQTSTATTISLHRYAFDIDSIIKASSAIAGEIVHRNLVHRLLSIVLENAGADEGALIIETDAGLIIEAILSVVDGSFSLVSKPVEKSAAVCESALNLVVRTNDPLVVDEAFRDADYAGDPYIQERKVRSMMVIPIQHKGQRIGLLHVVNTHISQAFTPERLEVVKLLTTQIAVSLENARLYDEQRATLEAAARFVPREFLDALGMRSIREVSLSAGVRTTITVLFADIRRFTSISEQLSTDATFDLLNRYLKLVVPIIRKHQGFIDKYVGDAVMALFPGKPSDAVRAAQEIHAALQDFNAQQQASRNHRVTVGIGIHTGEVMLGTVGTADRLDTTVIGDTVNIAARLEELTKTYNTAILLSGETASLLDDNHAVLKPQGTEVIRGRMATVDLYSIET